ncbi:MAG: ribonuclease P protein component [Puniceicoccaceae bacterium 5H]|nr:MAG: ribonuclease P protein component [Puniceicoccaceae bacterium 5H]
MRLTPRQHIRRTAEFQTVRQSGRGRECGPFLFQLREVSDSERPPLRRVGVIASKRLGNAVQRNRAKRRLRELFRLYQQRLPANCDLVLVGRRRILEMDWPTCVQRFCLTAERLPASARAAEKEPS